jgi:aryl-alcohol dehydrogenase-like predicted oxidoreductase
MISVIRGTIEHGVPFFDMAEVYSAYRHEEPVVEALPRSEARW